MPDTSETKTSPELITADAQTAKTVPDSKHHDEIVLIPRPSESADDPLVSREIQVIYEINLSTHANTWL